MTVGKLLCNRVASEVDISEAGHPAQVLELVYLLDVISFEIQHLQVLSQTDVEKLLYGVVRDVELLQLLKGLDALDFF